MLSPSHGVGCYKSTNSPGISYWDDTDNGPLGPVSSCAYSAVHSTMGSIIARNIQGEQWRNFVGGTEDIADNFQATFFMYLFLKVIA